MFNVICEKVGEDRYFYEDRGPMKKRIDLKKVHPYIERMSLTQKKKTESYPVPDNKAFFSVPYIENNLENFYFCPVCRSRTSYSYMVTKNPEDFSRYCYKCKTHYHYCPKYSQLKFNSPCCDESSRLIKIINDEIIDDPLSEMTDTSC